LNDGEGRATGPDKLPCRAPSDAPQPVCRLHCGKVSGLKGERNEAFRAGRYTAETKAERRQVRMLIGGLRHPIDSSEQAPWHLYRHLFRR
jgi:hypothetical protein